MTKEFFARGKLLLTGEYAVLEGATAIAIPCKKGQRLKVSENGSNTLNWSSYNNEGEKWFFASLDLSLNLINSNPNSQAVFLQKLLQTAFGMSSKAPKGVDISSFLDFPRNWGLGSSSTLIHLVSQWLDVDAMKLFFKVSDGSGYDIACAGTDEPIIYKLEAGTPSWENISLPLVLGETFFVHLNKKQKSDKEVQKFRKREPISQNQIAEISSLSQQILLSKSVKSLCHCMDEHEKLMSKMLGQETIKSLLFHDFNGSIKSLGAWGGDFVMVCGNDVKEYFIKKGYSVIVPFNEMKA